MSISYWTFHLDTHHEKGARAILSQCMKTLNRSPIESTLEPYSKGGYMAFFQFCHDDCLSWQELVFDVLLFAQQLGTAWCLFGQLEIDPSGVLSKKAGAHIKIAGLDWVEWRLFNEDAHRHANR